ncbi:MAG: hypothetical protein Kow0059_08240 [Candidatus Sumerlaeia bacterium]
MKRSAVAFSLAVALVITMLSAYADSSGLRSTRSGSRSETGVRAGSEVRANPGFSATRERPVQAPAVISKSYRSAGQSSFEDPRSNPVPRSAAVETNSRSQAFRGRDDSSERVKAGDAARFDRSSDSRSRQDWSFSGAFSYRSGDDRFYGRYERDHFDRDRRYDDHYPRYRDGVDLHAHGGYWHRPVHYYHRPVVVCPPYRPIYYYPSYVYYSYPRTSWSVSLGYFDDDWAGSFSFSSGYPGTTVVTEVSTVRCAERVWVPGHYEYREETVVIPDGQKEWVPPVYEEYWDGRAWVRRQVGGGYWKTTPVTKTVTTRVWVEGYWATP